MYHLIDELTGTVKSRIVFESFDSFTELKTYIVENQIGLYKHIPGIKSYPNYTKCRSFRQLKVEMEKNHYFDWRLTISKSEDRGSKSRRVMDNLDHNGYITIKPLGNIRFKRYMDNGVSCKVGQILSNFDKKVVIHAIQYRVIQSTPKAVLIEWLGCKGSTTTWIPKNYLT